jgi:signal transduction histidine kinase
VLVTVTYLYLGQSLDHQRAVRAAKVEAQITRYLGDTTAHADPQARGKLHQTLNAQFVQHRDDTLRAMLLWSLASLGVVGALAAGIGWLLAGRALHPLQHITATARRVAGRNLHERIALSGPDDEIKDLADTFDAMLERLDRAFDGRHRFIDNASHELRTPLTINRTMIEVALDAPHTPQATRQLGTALLEVNDRHERLIDGLLILATSDQHLTECAPLDLAEVARRATHTTADAACQAGVEVRATIAPAHVTGDPLLLEHLACNLLDNAIRYNITEGGWASITTGTANGHAYLTVENTGPQVPGCDVSSLFEPFRRLPSTDRLTEPQPEHGRSPRRRGAGLGLSIVRSVAHAHHGEVHTHPRPDGGLSIRVLIPTAARPTELVTPDSDVERTCS